MARPSNTNLELISVAEAASMMSVCQKTIRRRIAEGKLPAHQLGRLVRISMDDYRAFIGGSRDWRPADDSSATPIRTPKSRQVHRNRKEKLQ